MDCYFAGGCFWCITPIFAELDGVKKVISGFSGGDEENPSYEDVKHQKTMHRETIKIEYDEEKVSFRDLLDIFLNHVDILDNEGQFIDRGRSYTLAVYYTSIKEKDIAVKRLSEIEEIIKTKPCVSVEEFKSFYPADDYHQDYYKKNPEAYEKELKESGRKK